MSSLRDWLQSNGLGRHSDTFEKNGIDLDVVANLNESDLRELGLNLGDRKRLMAAIASAGNGKASRAASAHAISVDAERRQLTVMFCDLVGSTQLSQKLDPEELRRLIRQYQDVCAGAVARYEGHVAQFLGDGVLVYFGYPKAHEGEAERAIRAGLDIVDHLGELSSERTLQVRIGIDTGLVVIGQGDALNEQERTAIGDAPNVAARLQGLANPNTIVISERAKQIAGRGFDYADLGTHRLKGIDEPLRAWQVTGERQVETRFDAATGGLAAPMVGREMELDIAMQAWKRAKAGKLQVLLLCGEPGIGKSRILRAIREKILSDGGEAWQYQCSTFFTNTALYPTISNIERALGFERRETQESKLSKLEAFMRERFGRPDVDINLIGRLFNLPTEQKYGQLAMSPQKQKDETIRALIDIVDTQARAKPLLILFEDVHWADPTTIEELDQALKRTNMAALMVLTYRPEFTPAWIGQSHVTALTLNRLDATQTEQVATRVAGNRRLPKEIVEQIIQKTDGIPLFVEELTKAILETDLVREQDGEYILTRQLTALAIPATLHDSLMARLDRLAPTKEAAQIGACIGREFSHELLSLVSTQTEDQLNRAIEQLLASELVFAWGEGKDAIYAFKHALVQDAAYESLLKSKRAEIHAKIATTLEARFPQIKDTEPELLAHHWDGAGCYVKSVPLWQAAGANAISRSSLAEAIAHLNHGVASCNLIDNLSDKEKFRVELLTARGVAYMAMRGWPAFEVGENLSEALQLAIAQDREDLLVPIFGGLFWNLQNPGPVRDSLHIIEKTFEEARLRDSQELELLAHTLAVSGYFWLGELNEVVAHTRRLSDIYEVGRGKHIQSLLSHDPKVVAQMHCTQALWMLGYPDQALQLYQRNNEHAESLGNYFDMGVSLVFGANTLVFLRDLDRLRTTIEKVTQVAKDQRLIILEAMMVRWLRAEECALCARHDQCIEEFREFEKVWTAVGGGISLPYLWARCAEELGALGKYREAFRLLDRALGQIEKPGWEERVHLAEILRIRGDVYARMKDNRIAKESYVASLDWARKQQAKSWELRTSTSLARLWQSQGKQKEAHDLLAPVYNWFTEGFDTKDLKEAKALLEELQR